MQITGGTFTGGMSLGSPVINTETQTWVFAEDLSQFADGSHYIRVDTSWSVDSPNNQIWVTVDNQNNFKTVHETYAGLYSYAYDNRFIGPNTYASGSILNIPEASVDIRFLSNSEIQALFVGLSANTRIDLKQNGTANAISASYVSGSLGWVAGNYRLTLTLNENLISMGNYCGAKVYYTSNALNTLAVTGA